MFRLSNDDGALFLWCSKGGWLVSHNVGLEPDDPGALLTDFVAWGKLNTDDQMAVPMRLHVPFWKKKCCEGIKVWEYIHYLHVEKPMQDNARGDAVEDEIVQNADEDDRDLIEPNEDIDDEVKLQANPTQQPSVWLNKVTRRIAAYVREQWTICDALVAPYMTNPKVKKLTGDVMRKGEWAMEEPLTWKP